MLGYRIQACIDNETYKSLCEYMEENDIEYLSSAVRKIVTKFLSKNLCDNPKL